MSLPSVLLSTVSCILILMSLAVALYYLLLALVGITLRPRGRISSCELSEATNSFCILIPAHNEERTITPTLAACDNLDYPRHKIMICVVADNCTDKTAEMVREKGFLCLERHDPFHKGKGHALAWALPKILPAKPDAVVVLDADCTIDRQALRVFDRLLNRGCSAIQAAYVAGNPEASPIAFALALGNFIENFLFYSPKSSLGLSVFLRGTGMVFSRKILERFIWTAASLTEDTEYGLMLLSAGMHIHFTAEAQVHSDFPQTNDQLSAQRERWNRGNISLARKQAFRLIWLGCRTRRLALVDAGWSLLILSRPIIALHLALALLMAALCTASYPSYSTRLLLLAGIASVCVHFTVLVMAVFLFGLNSRRMKLLVKFPLVFAALCANALNAFLARGPASWQKTPRRS